MLSFRTVLVLVIGIVVLPAHAEDKNAIIKRDGYRIRDTNVQNEKVQYDTNTYVPLTALSQEELVNTDCGSFGSDQNYPDVAQDDQGNFLTVWLDERTGSRRLDAQVYDSSGVPIGPVIRISDLYNDWNSQPHVIFNSVSGEYVIVWAENGANIRLQRVSRFGNRIGANVTITDKYILNTNNPSLAVDATGNMMAVWTSQGMDFGTEPLYGRRLDRSGKPLAPSFSLMRAPYDRMSSYGWEKKIASDGRGRFLTVWSTFVGSRHRIIVQAFDTSGAFIGSGTVLSDPADSVDHTFPTVTGLNDGRFLVAWSSSGSGLTGRVYSIDSGIISPQLDLSNNREGWFMLGLTSDRTSHFYCAYTGYTSTGTARGILRLSGKGEVIDSTHVIPETYFNAAWYYPNLAEVKNGRYPMTYFGYIGSENDVIVQRFSSPILRNGTPLKMGNDSCSSHQLNPAAAVNGFGEVLVVWEDKKTSSPTLVGQLYNASGIAMGGNFTINEPSRSKYVSNAEITADTNGSFIVRFAGGDYSTRDLYVQRVLRTGALSGANINITNMPYSANGYRSVIVPAPNDRYRIAWFGLGTSYSTCSSRLLDKNLMPISSIATVLGSSLASPRWMFDLAMNAQNELLVLWSDVDNKYSTHGNGLKAMLFDAAGKAITDTIRIRTIPDSRWYMSAACSMDDERNMFIAYSEFELTRYFGAITFYRRYADGSVITEPSIDISGTRPAIEIPAFKNKKAIVTWYLQSDIRGMLIDDQIGTVRPVLLRHYPSVFSSWFDASPSYSVAMNTDTVQLAFADVRDQERGYDIMKQTLVLDQFDFQKGLIPDTTMVESLSRTYPNPNKGKVTFMYQITAPMYVEISVYNVLGQKVKVLVAGSEKAGTHYTTFETTGLPSGVYFLHYKGYRTQTQKFVITH